MGKMYRSKNDNGQDIEGYYVPFNWKVIQGICQVRMVGVYYMHGCTWTEKEWSEVKHFTLKLTMIYLVRHPF
jgi:hypothetical protein